MESEIPILEMSREDDSLLPRNPDLAENSNAETKFMSPMKVFNNRLDRGKPGCLSSIISRNKENINVNKSEVPKLCAEPMSMKRKKKGGSYNLRKSLAWDKAFFTEEGVLDPVELSLLNGTCSNSCAKILSNINDEDTSLKDDRGKGSFQPNYVSPSPYKVSHKVISAHDSSRTRSRSSGCPRPLPSAPLKRHAAVNASIAATKESKIPKNPVWKSGPVSSSLPTKSSMLGASQMKRNQITQSVDIHKDVSSKTSYRIVKSSQDKAISGSESLPRPRDRHSEGNVAKESVQSDSTGLCSPLIRKTDGFEVSSNVTLLSRRVHCPAGQDDSKSSTCFSQKKLAYAGDRGSTKTQRIRPSGLRMPSPSLGYFAQPKDSFSHGLSHKTALSSISVQSKLGNVVLQPTQEKVSSVTKEMMMAGGISRTLESSHEDPSSSNFAVFEEKIERNLEQNMKQQRLEEVLNGKGFEAISGKDVMHNRTNSNTKVYEHGGRKNIENILLPDNRGLEMNDELWLRTSNLAHLMNNDNVRTNFSLPAIHDSIESDEKNTQLMSQKDYGDCSKFQPENDVMMDLQDGKKFHGSYQMAEMKKKSAIPEIVKSGVALTCDVVNNLDSESTAEDFNERKIQGSVSLSQVKNTISLNEGADELRFVSQTGDAQEWSFDGSESEEYSSRDPSDSNMDEKSSKSNTELLCNDELITEKVIGLAFQESLHDSGFDFVRGHSDANESDLGRLGIDVTQEPHLVPNTLDADKTYNDRCFDDFPSDSRNAPSLSENDKLFDIPHNDLQRIGCGSISLKFDSASASSIHIDHVTRLITGTGFCCLSGEAASPAERNQTSPRSQGGDRFKQDVLPKELVNELHQNIGNPVDKFDDKLSHSMSVLEEKHAITTSKSSQNGSGKDNLSIMPRRNAVPFSEEWLEAIEAAGEDILTMKSGAVQNSPTDKSMPEPGPWSPVKRKNNQIGPFDCTKFNHIIPPDSQ